MSKFKIGDRVVFTQLIGNDPPYYEWEAIVIKAEVRSMDEKYSYYSYLIEYDNGERRWVLPQSIRIDSGWLRDRKIDDLLK